MLRTLSDCPDETVPQASQNRVEAQSIYRFWSNPHVSASQIIASQRDAVLQRVNRSQVVLVAQDTTDLNFGTNRPKTTGLGFFGRTVEQGMKVHSALAISGEGEPLGLLHQYSWSRLERSGRRATYKRKPTAQKENQRWLDTAKAATVGVKETVTLVQVGDREADFYDFLAQPRQAHHHLLIRAVQNRHVQHELGYLLPTIQQAPELSRSSLPIQRRGDRPAYLAQLSLRAMRLTLDVPKHHPQAKQFQPIEMNVLWVQELDPPTGQAAISWLLLTTLPIDDAQEAWQCVQWYSYRWLIERFHFALKQGCHIEALQLSTAAGLEKALATYSIIACRILWLTYRARLHPEQACDSILETSEWRLLRRKFEPRNRSRQPPTFGEAIRWIARLGGFLGNQEQEPGLRTLWRGMSKLQHLIEGAQLAANI